MVEDKEGLPVFVTVGLTETEAEAVLERQFEGEPLTVVLGLGDVEEH